MSATIRRVARPRGELTLAQARRLEKANERRVATNADYRAVVLAIMAEGASFAEMSRATGLSTNTLQRWKREGR